MKTRMTEIGPWSLYSSWWSSHPVCYSLRRTGLTHGSPLNTSTQITLWLFEWVCQDPSKSTTHVHSSSTIKSHKVHSYGFSLCRSRTSDNLYVYNSTIWWLESDPVVRCPLLFLPHYRSLFRHPSHGTVDPLHDPSQRHPTNGTTKTFVMSKTIAFWVVSSDLTYRLPSVSLLVLVIVYWGSPVWYKVQVTVVDRVPPSGVATQFPSHSSDRKRRWVPPRDSHLTTISI